MSCVLSLVFALTACGDDKKTEKKEEKTEAVKTESPIPTPGAWATAEEIDAYEAKLAEHIKLEKADAEYEYTQKVEKIDDKYGNYYQIFVYSFCDSDGDGWGDLNGITSKLDYIEESGFTGLWLTPIFKAGEYHKYHTVDYLQIDPKFGTMADFEKLVAECEKRDIDLILDLVMNHTSTTHEWFESAKASILDGTYASNKYYNYYNFQTTKKENCYQIGKSGIYYEGSFNANIPDLNLMNEDVRKEFETIAKFWLDKGISGFRLDAALHFVEEDTVKNTEILKWFTDYVYGINKDAYIVAEVWTGIDDVIAYYGGGIDSAFNFAFGGNDGLIATTLRTSTGAQDYEEALINLQNKLSEHKDVSTIIDAPFMSNHDLSRMSGYFADGEKKIKMAHALSQMMSGNSFVYYGDELGMIGSGSNDTNFRAPMYWSSTDSTGMPKPPTGCKITNADHVYGSVEEQKADSNSIYNYVKRVLQLRNENPEIARGTTEIMEGIDDTAVIAISKTYKNETIYILMNTSKYAKEVKVSKDDYGFSDIRGYVSADEYKPSFDGDTLKMPGCSVVILK